MAKTGIFQMDIQRAERTQRRTVQLQNAAFLQGGHGNTTTYTKYKYQHI